jgi:hypothetical protein
MSVPPCGASPLAGWAPDEIEAPVNAARLADKLSPQTGEMTLLEGEHPVDASIAFAFRAKYGAGIALGRKGQKFGDIKKNDRNAAASIAHEAQRVMKPFVDRELGRHTPHPREHEPRQRRRHRVLPQPPHGQRRAVATARARKLTAPRLVTLAGTAR